MGALTEMMTAGLVAAEDSHGGAIAFPVLTMLILVPIAGAVAVAISSKRRQFVSAANMVRSNRLHHTVLNYKESLKTAEFVAALSGHPSSLSSVFSALP